MNYIKGIAKNCISIIGILKRRKLINSNYFDYVYTNTGSIYMGYIISKIFHIKHVWHIREFGREDQNRISYEGEKRFYKRLNESDIIIAISDSLRNYLKTKGVNSQKIHLIYNDVNYEVDRISEEHFSRDQEILALSCGGIQKNKGHLLAIKAIKKLNESGIKATLYIAGSVNTPYFKTLKNYVDDNLMNEAIVFCDFVSDMVSLRNKCNVAIIGSSSEAFGRVTIEAMMNNLLVVGSNAAGTGELICDMKTGLLFENNNENSLYEILSFAYKNKKNMKEIIRNGHLFALDFSKEKAAKSIATLLLE